MSIDNRIFDLTVENYPFGVIEPPLDLLSKLRKKGAEYIGCHDKVSIECELGHLLVKSLHAIHSIDISAEKKIKAIKSLRSYYTEVLGKEEFSIFWPGFVAEFACMSCFTDAGYDVYEPSLIEDTLHAVDFWVDLKKSTYVGVQVKTAITDRNPFGNIFFPVYQGDVLRNVGTYWQFRSEESGKRLVNSLAMLSEYTRRFSNITGVLAVVPSLGSQFSFINEQSSLLPKKFMGDVISEFEEKMVYAQRRQPK